MSEKNYPNNIREARKARRLTMKQLGELIGAAESSVSQYETGKRQPDNEMLLRIAEALDTTVGYLLGAETEKAPAGEGERAVTEDDIKAAFWGGEDDLPEEAIAELWEDAKSYIAFKTEQMRKKRRK